MSRLCDVEGTKLNLASYYGKCQALSLGTCNSQDRSEAQITGALLLEKGTPETTEHHTERDTVVTRRNIDTLQYGTH
jgi:hypothetical protein